MGSEYTMDTDRFTVRGDLYLPPGADITGEDTVGIPGYGEFNVDGPVERWPDVGGLGHVHVRLIWFQEYTEGAPDAGVVDGGGAAEEPVTYYDGGGAA